MRFLERLRGIERFKSGTADRRQAGGQLVGPVGEAFHSRFSMIDSNLAEGSFKGVASVFDSLITDTWLPTIIERGAFTKTLLENGKRVKILWQHDYDKPIGKPTGLMETDRGLEVEAKVSQTECGKDALTLMRDGVVDEMSIGFDAVKWEMEDRGQGDVIRHVREVRLYEISLVTLAAQPQARVMSLHSLGNIPFHALALAIGAKTSGSDDGLTLAALACALREMHEGKVLSTKNKKLVADAVDALQALLAAAEPPASDDESKALTEEAERYDRMLREAQIELAQLQLR